MSFPSAHRNRWLALEQELQARRSQCHQQSSESQSLHPAHPPASLWQRLAVQLTRNQPRRSRLPSLDDHLPPPQFILDQLAPFQPPSNSAERSSRLSPPKTRPVPSRNPSINPSDTLEDNPPLDTWKDLAAQIQQIRASNPRS